MKRKNGLTEKIVEERLFNFRPLFFVAVFLCLGVSFGYLYLFKNLSAWWTALLLPVLSTSFFFARSWKRTAVGVLTLSLSFFIGFGLFCGEMKEYNVATPYEGSVTVTGTVIEKSENGNGAKVVLDDISVDGKEEKWKLVAYLSTPFSKTVALSDVVVLEGDINFIEELSANYVVDGVRYFIYDTENCLTVRTEFDLGRFLRHKMREAVYARMDETPADLTVAVLTGDTSGIESGTLENVHYGGIAHIFAVSGMHIGALYAFCRLLTDKTGLKKTPKLLRFILTAVVLLFYGSVCGFSASVVRAICLCLALYACSLSGLNFDFLEGLGLGAIVVLCGSPSSLFAVGCQLSFASCLGLGLLARPIKEGLEGAGTRIKRLFLKNETPKTVKNGYLPPDTEPLSLSGRVWRSFLSLASASLSAQAFTAPILVCSFGYVSTAGLLLNLVFVPLLGATFAALLALVVLACILPFAAPVFLYLPSLLWTAIFLPFETLDLSAFLWKPNGFSVGAILLYYVVCLLLSEKLNLKRWRWIYVAAGAVACLLCVCLGVFV